MCKIHAQPTLASEVNIMLRLLNAEGRTERIGEVMEFLEKNAGTILDGTRDNETIPGTDITIGQGVELYRQELQQHGGHDVLGLARSGIRYLPTQQQQQEQALNATEAKRYGLNTGDGTPYGNNGSPTSNPPFVPSREDVQTAVGNELKAHVGAAAHITHKHVAGPLTRKGLKAAAGYAAITGATAIAGGSVYVGADRISRRSGVQRNRAADGVCFAITAATIGGLMGVGRNAAQAGTNQERVDCAAEVFGIALFSFVTQVIARAAINDFCRFFSRPPAPVVPAPAGGPVIPAAPAPLVRSRSCPF